MNLKTRKWFFVGKKSTHGVFLKKTKQKTKDTKEILKNTVSLVFLCTAPQTFMVLKTTVNENRKGCQLSHLKQNKKKRKKERTKKKNDFFVQFQTTNQNKKKLKNTKNNKKKTKKQKNQKVSNKRN